MENRETIKLLMEFNRLHRLQVQEIMESEGLYFGQLPILEVVHSLGCCTQKEIATALRVTPPTVATSVKRLMKKGYLIKTVDENDQRNNLITITNEGKEKTCACRKKFDELDSKIFESFKDDEKQILSNLLLKLISSIKKEENYD